MNPILADFLKRSSPKISCHWVIKAVGWHAGEPLWIETEIKAFTFDNAIAAFREMSDDTFIYSVTTKKPQFDKKL